MERDALLVRGIFAGLVVVIHVVMGLVIFVFPQPIVLGVSGLLLQLVQ